MILILAGTAEARAVARGLAERGVPALASLAGAVREPAPMAVPTRLGGFGGEEGLAAALAGVRAVVDATHPFAARITERAHRVCGRLGVPLLRLQRPGFREGPGDRWRRVGDVAQAVALVPQGARLFLATGRGGLGEWEGVRAAKAWVRVVDPPGAPLPFEAVVARPPFDRAAEAALFRRLGVTHLAVKDSGGEGRGKLDAARDLGVAVLMLERTPLPRGLEVVEEAGAAVHWALRQAAAR